MLISVLGVFCFTFRSNRTSAVSTFDTPCKSKAMFMGSFSIDTICSRDDLLYSLKFSRSYHRLMSPLFDTPFKSDYSLIERIMKYVI